MSNEEGNNIIPLEKYQRPKNEVSQAVQEALQIGHEKIGTNKEAEYKIYATIYRIIIDIIAETYGTQHNEESSEIGSLSYDSSHSSMQVGVGPVNDFREFLQFVKAKLYLVPDDVKKAITLFLYEHDNAADAPGAKIDSSGFTIIEDTSSFPPHDQHVLYSAYEDPYDNEMTRLRDLATQLRLKLLNIAI